MVHHLYVVEILNLLMGHLMQDEVHLVVQQILDAQNLDAIPPFLVVVPQFPQVAAVDAELRHLLKMDCYQDEVDAERRHLLKKDCYQGAELLELLVLEPPALPMLLQMQPLPHLAQPFQHREMP